jgi:hypothetical protein
VIEKAQTPNLSAIAKVGGFKRAYVGGQKGLILKLQRFLRLVIIAF